MRCPAQGGVHIFKPEFQGRVRMWRVLHCIVHAEAAQAAAKNPSRILIGDTLVSEWLCSQPECWGVRRLGLEYRSPFRTIGHLASGVLDRSLEPNACPWGIGSFVSCSYERQVVLFHVPVTFFCVLLYTDCASISRWPGLCQDIAWQMAVCNCRIGTNKVQSR